MALDVSGVALVDDWSYAGWACLTGMEASWGEAYDRFRDQDPSRQIILESLPGAFWLLKRDADAAAYRSDIYRAFVDHRFHDLAVCRLPNAVFGNIAVGFYRHRGLPLFDEDDQLLLELLHPHQLTLAFFR